MTDKAIFAGIINRRLTELDQSGAWLARKTGVSEASISRYRDELKPDLPQNPDIVHRIAKHLGLDDEERSLSSKPPDWFGNHLSRDCPLPLPKPSTCARSR